MARLLFFHTRFPGQFRWIAPAMAASGKHEVVALTEASPETLREASELAFPVRFFGKNLSSDRPSNHILSPLEMFVRRGAAAALEAEKMRREGFDPQVIYVHTGWGAGAFLHNVFPRARLVKYTEWYYNRPDTGIRFLSKNLPAQRLLADDLLNLPVLAELAHFDRLIAPTNWQRAQFPEVYRDRISVVPDGLDPLLFNSTAQPSFQLQDGRTLNKGDPIITYVARGADSFRGFGVFIKCLHQLQARGCKFQCLIAGEKKSFYGEEQGTESQYRSALDNVSVDPDRIHFLGTISRERFRQLLAVSQVHVYLTVPFVLSWSMLEAMATGCCVVASDTEPVREFVRSGVNGILANYFDIDGLADAVDFALKEPGLRAKLGAAARLTASERWGLDTALSTHMDMVKQLTEEGEI